MARPGKWKEALKPAVQLLVEILPHTRHTYDTPAAPGNHRGPGHTPVAPVRPKTRLCQAVALPKLLRFRAGRNEAQPRGARRGTL